MKIGELYNYDCIRCLQNFVCGQGEPGTVDVKWNLTAEKTNETTADAYKSWSIASDEGGQIGSPL